MCSWSVRALLLFDKEHGETEEDRRRAKYQQNDLQTCKCLLRILRGLGWELAGVPRSIEYLDCTIVIIYYVEPGGE